jgi:hypothetical protein
VNKDAEMSFRTQYKKITFSELNSDMDIEEFHQLCKELASAAGYASMNIQEYFGE